MNTKQWGAICCAFSIFLFLDGCAKAPAAAPPTRPVAITLFPVSLTPAVTISPEPSRTKTATPIAAVSPAPTVSATSAPDPAALPAGWWQPKPGLAWQYQLSGDYIDDSFSANVYDVDLSDASADVVESLHLQHRRVVCYFSAGTREEERDDSADFPASVVGKADTGWPGEKWLDIRAIDLLAPVLLARLDLCGAMGFDGADPDNVDGYQNATGFPLTADDQLRFNRWLAAEAHKRGLAVGLKNDPDQAADLQPDFDWALAEECFDQNWCGKETPFLRAGKPVVDVEYTDTKTTLASFCPAAKKQGITAIYKKRSLDAWLRFCP